MFWPGVSGIPGGQQAQPERSALKFIPLPVAPTARLPHVTEHQFMAVNRETETQQPVISGRRRRSAECTGTHRSRGDPLISRASARRIWNTVSGTAWGQLGHARLLYDLAQSGLTPPPKKCAVPISNARRRSRKAFSSYILPRLALTGVSHPPDPAILRDTGHACMNDRICCDRLTQR